MFRQSPTSQLLEVLPTPTKMPKAHIPLSSWWFQRFQPSKRESSPSRDENKKCLKPPPSYPPFITEKPSFVDRPNHLLEVQDQEIDSSRLTNRSLKWTSVSLVPGWRVMMRWLLVGGFNPFWKIWTSNLEHLFRGENKNYLKPPLRLVWMVGGWRMVGLSRPKSYCGNVVYDHSIPSSGLWWCNFAQLKLVGIPNRQDLWFVLSNN